MAALKKGTSTAVTQAADESSPVAWVVVAVVAVLLLIGLAVLLLIGLAVLLLIGLAVGVAGGSVPAG